MTISDNQANLLEIKRQDKKQALIAYLTDLYYHNESFLAQIFNEWKDVTGDPDSRIFEDVEELAELFGDDPVKFGRAIYFGKIDNWGDFVRFNGYGNIVSVFIEDYEIEDLAEWLIDTESGLISDWSEQWEEENADQYIADGEE